ncbi:hemocytin-like isoform X2 [Ornithodoros turicata]|uniref:hemocytin-like isoform X2 n=1 Tax=Ornithodoros turicata TaxID=34597 RepID=UPI0031388DB7
MMRTSWCLVALFLVGMSADAKKPRMFRKTSKGGYSEISETCETPCLNGGRCYKERCVCPPGYRGNACQHSVSLCDPLRALNFKGESTCNHTVRASTCILKCGRGFRYSALPLADVYTCSVSGEWSPSELPQCTKDHRHHRSHRLKHTSGTCVVWGLGHFRTFDGSLFSFRSRCRHLLTHDCKGDVFSVHVDDHSCDKKTCLRTLEVYVEGQKYGFTVEPTPRVLLENTSVAIPTTLEGLRVQYIAGKVLVSSDLGFSIMWNGADLVQVSAKDELKGSLCGLCGQYDGDPTNDFVNKHGRQVTSRTAFIDSWKMDDLGDECEDIFYDPSKQHRSEEIVIEARRLCSKVERVDFEGCHELVDPRPYEHICLDDYGACSKSNSSCSCDSLAEYFRECQRLGGKMERTWRNAEFCAPQCPDGMVYSQCGASCPRTCRDPEPTCKNSECVDGCHCPPGTYLHNGTCLTKEECPCLLHGEEYSTGARVEQECNACECKAGEWQCTDVQCPSRCTAHGGPLYSTFDEKPYEFTGRCPYYLIKSPNFTVVQETGHCPGGLTPEGSHGRLRNCFKVITVTTGDDVVVLKRGEVLVNNDDVMLPFFNGRLTAYSATSEFIKVKFANGVVMLWDRQSRLYIDSPPEQSGQFKGLCGTNNLNQKDDFGTEAGDVEVEVASFTNKWKANEDCLEPDDTNDHPCGLVPQRVPEAKRLCGSIYEDVFKRCHSVVDPEPYYKMCLYRTCTCEAELKSCICPAFAEYGAECARKGQGVNWRQRFPVCSQSCPKDQLWSQCNRQRNCYEVSRGLSSEACVEGCACALGYLKDGICVLKEECPCFHRNKEIPPGGFLRKRGELCECGDGKWQCFDGDSPLTPGVNTSLALHGIARTITCSDEDNVEYTPCLESCPQTCDNINSVPTCDTVDCKPGCRCKAGYVLDTDVGRCIPESSCGCKHGGRKYEVGSVIRRDCNKCTCRKGYWDCQEKKCPGVCTVWGESHFNTFDGRIFDFRGDCEYMLAKGRQSDTSRFEVTVQNVPCTSGDTVCRRIAKVVLGDEVVTLGHAKTLPSVRHGANYAIRETPLQVTVFSQPFGIIVEWDKGTRLSVQVQPSWAGKVKGLCGNYNENQMDDFQTPSGGISEGDVRNFGDSWKVQEFCPATREVTDSCQQHPHRMTWAVQKCEVLRSELFEPCHSAVAIEPYYQRCVQDVCNCDSGGDCECLCTNVAAYAHECSAQGVPIKWRSQELCPIQCNGECSEYDACVPACPPKTCEMLAASSQVKEICDEETCFEGCLPKPCPTGMVYNNERELKCVPVSQCKVPCKEIYGAVYYEGDRITDERVAEPCESCYCQQNSIVCTGHPCPTAPPAFVEECTQTGWTPWHSALAKASGQFALLGDAAFAEWYGHYCGKESIAEIECRVQETEQSASESGQKVTCELPRGLACYNRDQVDGGCLGYQVRLFCNCAVVTEPVTYPSPTTTAAPVTREVTPTEDRSRDGGFTAEPSTEPPELHAPTLPARGLCTPGWTEFFNLDNPATGEGDLETMENIRKSHDLCSDDLLAAADCQAVVDGQLTDYTKTGDIGVKCSKKAGLVCVNWLQPRGRTCHDYAIRFYCTCDLERPDVPPVPPVEEEAQPTKVPAIPTEGIPEDMTLPATHACTPGWSSFFDSDVPSTGAGDFEILENMQDLPCRPAQVEDIECKAVSQETGDLLDWTETGDAVTCSVEKGLTCFNQDQGSERQCHNYKVRVKCSCVPPGEVSRALPTTSSPLPKPTRHAAPPGPPEEPHGTCRWTGWLDADSPNDSPTDMGDFETLKLLKDVYGVCDGDDIHDIQCRVKGTGEDWKSSGQSSLSCDTRQGFRCYNKFQIEKCLNYEVRLLCNCEPEDQERIPVLPPLRPTEGIPETVPAEETTTVPTTVEPREQTGAAASTGHTAATPVTATEFVGTATTVVVPEELTHPFVVSETSEPPSVVSESLTQTALGTTPVYGTSERAEGPTQSPPLSETTEPSSLASESATEAEGSTHIYIVPELSTHIAVEAETTESHFVVPEEGTGPPSTTPVYVASGTWHPPGTSGTTEHQFVTPEWETSANETTPHTVISEEPVPPVAVSTTVIPEIVREITDEGSETTAPIEPAAGRTVPIPVPTEGPGSTIRPFTENPTTQAERVTTQEQITTLVPEGPHVVPVTEAPRCPPGQVYSDCAYRCDQTCTAFLRLLIQETKCGANTPDCIPGCRPDIYCEPPLVWHDYSTCISVSECSCVLRDKMLGPYQVVTSGCERCMCVKNVVRCEGIPGCKGRPPGGSQVTGAHDVTPPVIAETVPITTSPAPTESCASGWSEWFNTHSPDEYGDVESLEGIRTSGHHLCANHFISSVQCRPASDDEQGDEDEYIVCDVHKGMICENAAMPSGRCRDYAVRFHCDCPEGGTEIVVTPEPVPSQEPYTEVYVPSPTTLPEEVGRDVTEPTSEEPEEQPTVPPTPQPRPAVRAPCTKYVYFVNGPSPLPASRLTASSSASVSSNPDKGRLGSQTTSDSLGAWIPRRQGRGEFVQADLGGVRLVYGVVTQGRERTEQRVTRYRVLVSEDGESLFYLHGDDGQPKELVGNHDATGVMRQLFLRPVKARYVRIEPTAWNEIIALRFDILGCLDGPTLSPPLEQEPTAPANESTTVLCPELPDILYEHCPECPSDTRCDGASCIPAVDCPCFQDSQLFGTNQMIQTSTCDVCVCTLYGHSECSKKQCSCSRGQRPGLDQSCKCKCEYCPMGQMLCPTSQECIDETKWCNGVKDCPDDEVNCPAVPPAMPPCPKNEKPSCSPGHYAKMVRKSRCPEYTCVPEGKEDVCFLLMNAGTCTVAGNTFRTFDGREFRYEICNNVLLQEKEQMRFSVTAHKQCTNTGICSRSVSIKNDQVFVKLGPTLNDISVNGIIVDASNLGALNKRLKSIHLSRNGKRLLFRSLEHNFQVALDDLQNVQIGLSECLTDRTNGMCGTFNYDASDDFKAPDDRLLQTGRAFGDSWATASSRCLRFECSEEARHHAHAACRKLKEHPLSACFESGGISTATEVCQDYVCECIARNGVQNAKQCSCQAIEGFAATCDPETRETISSDWRLALGCSPDCPAGMEWRDCGPACEKTCDNMHETEKECPEDCVAGCFCPPGQVRRGNDCVPPNLCHDCVCRGHGDPNYITFDGRYYDFQGSCDYVLASHVSRDDNLQFQVVGLNVECPEEPRTTCTNGIVVSYKNHYVRVERGRGIKIDETELQDRDLVVTRHNFNISRVPGQSATIFVPPIDLVVRYFELNYGFSIELPSFLYFNKTEGLCGVCNFDPSDDFLPRNGPVTQDVKSFAYSWLVDGTPENCQVKAPQKRHVQPEICKFEGNACDIYVDPDLYQKSCLNDAGYTRNLSASICRSKLQYAEHCCSDGGVSVHEWLKQSGCASTCPMNMEFRCDSGCVKTCENYKDAGKALCPLTPTYGCFCKQGYVLKEGKCVKPRDCEACDQEGHLVGDTWSTGPCDFCECSEKLQVRCTRTQCPPEPVCRNDEQLRRYPHKSGTCCDDYKCELKPRHHCRQTEPAKCDPGAVSKVQIDKNGCPSYVCACDVEQCPDLQWPTDLAPGLEPFIETSGCCKKVSVRCNIQKCPELRSCPPEMELKNRPGVCCTTYQCVPKNKCAYMHQYKVERGMQVLLHPDNQYLRMYPAGSSWTDGLCSNCTCMEHLGQFQHSCKVKVCPSLQRDSEDYDYVVDPTGLPGECCVREKRAACKGGGSVRPIGTVWQNPGEEKCRSYSCVQNPTTGEAEKIVIQQICNNTCARGEKFVPPQPGSGECCGKCLRQFCEENGKVYEVGGTWRSQHRRCFNAVCSLGSDGGARPQYTSIPCPALSKDCPPNDIVLDDEGCCKTCRTPPKACRAEPVPPDESTRIFTNFSLDHGNCENQMPIPGMMACKGLCESSSEYNQVTKDFVGQCGCCRVTKFAMSKVTLRCDDESEMVMEYKNPKECSCTKCGEDPDIILEEPDPQYV